MEKSTPEHRYRFIELIAWWEGSINTSYITRQFGISRQQASGDLTRYRELAPDNLCYNASRKLFLAQEPFTRHYISGNVVEYLTWLQTGHIETQEASEKLPSLALKLPPRQVLPQVMRGLVAAIRQQRRIEVDYVSLTNPNREGRIIAPHTFINTGLRWHLRAWCEKSQQYRDFVLSRFRGEPELLDKSPHTAEQDAAWNTDITLVFAPDPRLTPAKREVLEHDYQMKNGELRITTKACLVQYLIQEMQVNTKILDGTPEAQQLVLVNRDDIREWLFEG